MQKIINRWTKDSKCNCFGCSPTHPFGLRMEFFEDGDDIVSQWHPNGNYQGWVDTMHGGVLGTLIDEICGWVVTRKMQTCGYTTHLNLTYRKAISTREPELTIRARVVKQMRHLLFMHAEITDSAGNLCVEGDVTYIMMTPEKARETGFISCDNAE